MKKVFKFFDGRIKAQVTYGKDFLNLDRLVLDGLEVPHQKTLADIILDEIDNELEGNQSSLIDRN